MSSTDKIAAVLVRQYVDGGWVLLGIDVVPIDNDETEYAMLLSENMNETGRVTGLVDPLTHYTYTSACLSAGPIKVSPFTHGKKSFSWIESEYRKYEDDMTALSTKGIHG